MSNGGRINYSIGFTVDNSQLNQLKTSLQQVKNMTAQDFMKINNMSSLAQAQTQLNKIKATIKTVDVALEKAFNADLGTVNIIKFNEALKRSNTSIKQIQAAYSKMGAAGATAFRNLSTSLLTTNNQLKQTHGFLNTMSNTMKNTLKWGAASAVMNSFTTSIRSAYGYVKHLDTSLNDIRIVTGKSADEMERFAKTANDAAKRLGQSTTDYTEAALIYYQQGLGDSEAQTRAETTLKAANVTGQTGREVSEQLTAVWNGYKVSAQETELYVDKLAAVAASTASDLEELSTGMSKVASAASTSGVDIDQLNATLSTVISVTRQAPESVGTAFKTIYARLGDLAVDGVDEFGTSLGQVSSKLKTMGIDILDSQGNMRDMGTVVEEVAAKWDTWTSAQKQAAAVAMAGKRQYNNLIALFENWDMYEDALLTSANAAGTLQNQQDIYMESTAAHLKTLKASTEDVWDSIIDTDGINAVIDGLTFITNGIGAFTDAIGGSTGALALLGVVGLGAFKKDIAKGIATSITNMENMQSQTAKLRAEMEMLKATGAKVNNIFGNDPGKQINGLKAMQNLNQPYLSQEQINESNDRIRGINDKYNEIDRLKGQRKDAKDYINTVAQANKKDYSPKNLLGDIDIGKIVPSGDIEKDLTTIKNAFDKNFTDTLKKANQDVSKFTNGLSKIGGSAEAMNEHFQNSRSGINQFLKQAKVLERTGMVQGEAQQKLTSAYNEALQAMKNVSNTGKGHNKLQQALNVLQREYNAAVKSGSANLNTYLNDMQQYGAKVANLKAQIKEMTAAEIQMQRSASMQGVIQGYVGAAQAASMLTIGVSSLVSAFKVLGNESLSTGEKFLQFMTSITSAGASIAMGVTMLMSNVSAIKNNNLAYKVLTAQQAQQANSSKTVIGAHGNITKVIKLENEELKKNIALHKLAGKASVKRGPSVGKGRKVSNKTPDTFDTPDFFDKKSGKGKGLGPGVILDSLNKKLSNIGKNSKGPLKNVGKGLTDIGTKAGNAIKPLSKIPASIVGLGAAFSALSTASLVIWGISQALDAHNIKAEKAAKKAQELNLRYNEAKSGMDTFKQKVSNYDDAVKGLSDLVKGTQEYSDQIRAANDAALELLNTTKGLKADYSGDFITFKEDSLAQIEKEKAQHLATSQVLAVDAQKIAEQYQYNADVINAYRDLQWGGEFAKGRAKNSSGADTTALRFHNESADTFTSRAEFQEAVNDLSKILSEEEIGFNDAINKLNLTDPALEQALKDNQTEIEDLIGSNQELIQSQTLLGQVIAKAFLGEDYGYGQLKGYEQEYVSKELGKEYKNSPEYLKYYEESEWAGDKVKLQGRGSSVEQGEHAKEEAYQAYADANNLTYEKSGLFGKGVFRNASGEKEKYSESDVRRFLQTEDASAKYFSSQGEDFKATQEEIDRIYKATADNFSAGASGQDIIEEYLLKGFQSGNFNLDFGSLGALSDGDIQNQIDKINSLDDNTIKGMAEGTEMKGSSVKEIKNAIIEGLQAGLTKEGKEKRQQGAEEKSDADLEGFAEAESFDADELKQHRDLLLENEDAVKGNIEAATELAKVQQKQQRGMDNLCENWEDYIGILNDSEASYADQSKASKGVLDSLKDLYDLTEEELEMLPANFVKDNLDKIEAVKNGVEGAYEDLLAEIGKEVVIGLKLKPETETELSNAVDGIMNAIDVKDLEFGATLDDTGFTNALNAMLENGQIAQADLNAVFDAIQFDPEYTTKDVPANTLSKNWLNQTAEIVNEKGEVETVTLTSEHLNSEDIMVRVPVINGSKTTYKGGGGGLKSSKGSGGGGGGGGGSKPKKSYKSSENKRDRYREVNNSLKELGTELDRLSEKQEKLFGKDLLDNLNKQLDILEQQVSVTKEKLKLTQEEVAEMRQAKADQEPGKKNDLLDFGIVFDEDGNITNYQEKAKYWDAEVERLTTKFNNMSASAQEADKDKDNGVAAQLEKAEANRDKLNELVEKYDELLYDTIPGLEDEIVDAAYQQFELKLESFQLEADLRLDISEAIKDWKDFKEELGEFEFPEDLAKSAQTAMDALNAMKEMDLDNSGYMGLGQTLQRDINNLIAEQDAWRNNKTGYNGAFAAKDSEGNILKDSEGEVIFNEQAFMEAAQENMEELQDYILQQEEYLEQIHDNYLEGIEAVGESYEEQLEVLEYMGQQIEHNIRMTELLKGEEAYDDMATYYQMQIANLEATLAKQKESADYYKEQMNLATDEEAREKWREMYLDTLATYEETLESIAETVQAEFENFVQQQLQTVDEIMGAMSADGKYLGTSYVKSEWEIETGDSEEYLDLVERTYGIQSLANKIQGSIAETDSLSAQKKLNSLLDEQLEKLREKDKLTQYDLDRAEALYEIELKKIALEEAQNNKSQMRLRRDSSGNYSYQFVADEENVSQAQQELLDAQNSLYELDRDTLKEKQEEIISTQEEMYDLITEFSQLSAEERIAKEDEYMMKFADLQQRVIDLGGESAEIQNNLAQSAYDAMSNAYTQMGEDVSTLRTETMLPQWVGVMDEMIAKINGPEGSFKQAWDEAIGSIMNKDNETQSALDDVEEKSKDAYNSATESAQDWMASAEDTTEELKAQVDQLKDLNTEAEEYKKWWDDIKQGHVDALAVATEYYNLIRREEADKIEPEEENNQITGIPAGEKTNISPPSTPSAPPAPSTPAIKQAPSLSKGSYVDVKPDTKWYYTSYGASPWGYAKGGKIKYINSSGTHPYNIDGLGWIKKNRIVGYATGGYTGDWAGETGKLAMLHKKEMVLNSKDTENMLKAVKLLREFANGSNSQSSSRAIVSDEIQYQNVALKSASAMTASIDRVLNKLISSLEPFAIGISNLTKEEKSDTINIEINADFPNANSAKEIEKAFLHLTNIATQRAHSTKK